MNVSGLNIDVGSARALATTAWTIPHILVTPVPPNTTNTQIHLSEGPGGTPNYSSTAKKHSNFSCDFLLNPVKYQAPIVQSKQPSLNIPSGSQVHVGYEKG
ncbi:hypothetical protein O181_094015 [Austropuccinia psidii MF-1]|uniref:Uncharacterized protein n=1 Tax=Austropuccinia psidii MF-1 TaxID=1389203 RepID=A0A9Q3PAN8_9BASI|nr:hypothetical protein [Austropuccinia psidii MF-1]